MLSPEGSDPSAWVGTHIRFVPIGIAEGQKTMRWEVLEKDRHDGGGLLGYVRWFGRWRKYCFYPEGACVFEQTCMRELAQFIEDRTKEQRTGV